MGATWYTADPHFWHELLARLRGFSTVEEHNEAIIANHNKRVDSADTVWWAGDMTLANPARLWPLMDRLNGTPHLILGNHDRPFGGHRGSHRHLREYMEHFASVQAFARHQIAGQTVLLSHFPYQGSGDHTEVERHTQYRLPDRGEWLLHGHTHSDQVLTPPPGPPLAIHGGTTLARGRQIHVGLDAWGLRPVALHEIERLIQENDR